MSDNAKRSGSNGSEVKKVLFVKHFTGDTQQTVEELKKAGIKISYATARRYMDDLNVQQQIKDRDGQSVGNPEGILTRIERQQFWSNVTKSEDERMPDRLKASELLGKSCADFTEKFEHSGGVSVLDILAEARNRLSNDKQQKES